MHALLPIAIRRALPIGTVLTLGVALAPAPAAAEMPLPTFSTKVIAPLKFGTLIDRYSVTVTARSPSTGDASTRNTLKLSLPSRGSRSVTRWVLVGRAPFVNGGRRFPLAILRTVLQVQVPAALAYRANLQLELRPATGTSASTATSRSERKVAVCTAASTTPIASATPPGRAWCATSPGRR